MSDVARELPAVVRAAIYWPTLLTAPTVTMAGDASRALGEAQEHEAMLVAETRTRVQVQAPFALLFLMCVLFLIRDLFFIFFALSVGVPCERSQVDRAHLDAGTLM